MADAQKVQALIAWLVHKEEVDPRAIERAVTFAADLQIGESCTPDDDPLARAFSMEQTGVLLRG